MPTIRVPARVHAAIRAAVQDGCRFVDTSTSNPDGTVDIPVSDDVHLRLCHLAQEGETIADTLERVMTLAAANGRTH
jgi:hypothetical protein